MLVLTLLENVGILALASYFTATIWLISTWCYLEAKPARRPRNERTYWRTVIFGLIVIPIVYLLREIFPWPSLTPFASGRTWPITTTVAGTIAMGSSMAQLLRLLTAHRKLRNLIRRAPPLSDEATAERINTIAREMHLNPAHVRVRCSAEIAVPFVTPHTLYLPVSFANDSESAEFDRVVRHEMVHLRAKDPAWIAFANICLTCFPLHPLAWTTFKRLLLATEVEADRAAVPPAADERLAYCKQLLAITPCLKPIPGFNTTGALGTPSIFQQRVRWMLADDPIPSDRGNTARALAIAWIAFCIFLLCAVPLFDRLFANGWGLWG